MTNWEGWEDIQEENGSDGREELENWRVEGHWNEGLGGASLLPGSEC